MPSRREFLAAASVAALGLCLPIGRRGWAFAGPTAGRRLVVVFLRGAVDGLSVVVPHADRDYHALRPRIALAGPGKPGGVLDLDGTFGLHPALKPLLPYWQDRRLAFVHASGSRDDTRSHFDAQDRMERAAGGDAGWLNRLLAALPGPHAPNAALSVGPNMPRIFSGPAAVANMALGPNAARKAPLDRPQVAAAFDALYAADDALGRAYREGRAARAQLLDDLDDLEGGGAPSRAGGMTQDPEQMAANGGAPLPGGFAGDATQLARLLRKDAGIRLAFLGVGGWDTHVNQGAAQGQLAGRLGALGEGLAALARELGPLLADTVVVVMSEFGRTVAENGNGGTDHGHGNAMWVLGAGVRGGKVYGSWPGLAPDARHEGRDLAVTTDYRAVLGGVLRDHMGLDGGRLAAVLPGAPSPLAMF